jgi:hypothetical protein
MGGIIWIASFPRSGNTWVRNFLHNLLRPRADTHDINAMIGLSAYEISAEWYEGLLPKPIKDCSPEEVAKVRPQAQERLAAAADGLVMVKTHNALVRHEGVPLINARVTAGAIYIVRNPLDVAISYAHHLNTTIDQAIAAMNTMGYAVPNLEGGAYELYGSWSENVMSWTRKAHAGLHVLRYEDMLAEPLESFGKLASFLRLVPGDGELRAAIEKSSFERLRGQEEKHGFWEKPKDAKSFFREGRSGAWRQALSPEQIGAIAGEHAEQMARFGYDTVNAS